ncbi:hypothetical protein [Promicromonospora soli]
MRLVEPLPDGAPVLLRVRDVLEAELIDCTAGARTRGRSTVGATGSEQAPRVVASATTAAAVMARWERRRLMGSPRS